MGVPLISETNKNKELLLEIDSIVPDTNGHHLADISLSSNDSLSRSRRRWKLIKIISKMNPSFQGKSKKLIFYQSLSAILSMILTGIMIYWLVKLQSTSNSSELLPSSSFLVSSQSQSSSSSSLSPSSSTQSPPSKPEPTITLGWPGNYDPADYETFSVMDNPVLRLTENSNNTNGNDDVETLKVTDSISDKSGEDGEEKSEDEDNSLRKFPPPLPFPPFQSFPSNWFQGPFNGPLFLPPFFPPSSPPSQPPFQMMDPFESDESSNPIADQFFDHFTPPTFNLAKIKSSAQKLHASAVGALDELMKKLKGSGSLVDFLVTNNEDEQMDPELVVRSEDDQDQASDLMETFNDTDQLDDTVDNLFNLIKKIVF